MYNVPRSLTPERFYPSCHLRRIKCSFLLSERHQPSRISNIMELNPFNHLAFGPPPNCLRLKTKVTFSPPRLATSEWLVLSRRESHPLYDTTYARPHSPSLVEEKITLFCRLDILQRFVFTVR
jgi:hypothetical protein